MRTYIKCPGETYSGSTRVVHREASKDYYIDASAICDVCKERMKLLGGRRLPQHYLDVTIHGVQAP